MNFDNIVTLVVFYHIVVGGLVYVASGIGGDGARRWVCRIFLFYFYFPYVIRRNRIFHERFQG